MDDQNNKKYDALDVVFGVACLLVVIVFLTYIVNFWNRPIATDASSWGAFGDYIGGVINPILGFFSFMALLITLDLQRKQLNKTEEQLELNREELKLTREELKKTADAQIDSAKVMNEQLKTQALQQFDSLFFALLNQLTIKLSEFQKDPLLKQQEHFYKDNFERSKFQNLEALRSRLATQNQLSSFFIFLYQIMKNIDEKLPTYNLKKDYSNVVRSLIPSDINKWLLVNCAVNKNNDFIKFKELLVKFEFFEHIGFYGEGVYVSSNLIHVGSLYPVEAYGNNLDSIKIYQSTLFREFRKTSNFHKILISILEKTEEFKRVNDSYKDMSFVKENTQKEIPISKFGFYEHNSTSESYDRISVDSHQVSNFKLEGCLLYLQCYGDTEYKLQLKLTECGEFSIENIHVV